MAGRKETSLTPLPRSIGTKKVSAAWLPKGGARVLRWGSGTCIYHERGTGMNAGKAVRILLGMVGLLVVLQGAAVGLLAVLLLGQPKPFKEPVPIYFQKIPRVQVDGNSSGLNQQIPVPVYFTEPPEVAVSWKTAMPVELVNRLVQVAVENTVDVSVDEPLGVEILGPLWKLSDLSGFQGLDRGTVIPVWNFNQEVKVTNDFHDPVPVSPRP